jgi:hypothetical protein
MSCNFRFELRTSRYLLTFKKKDTLNPPHVCVCSKTRGVTIHFFHKQYLICITIRITIRFIGNCIYSLKSMLVDMGAAMFFLYEVAYGTRGNYKYLIFD